MPRNRTLRRVADDLMEAQAYRGLAASAFAVPDVAACVAPGLRGRVVALWATLGPLEAEAQRQLRAAIAASEGRPVAVRRAA